MTDTAPPLRLHADDGGPAPSVVNDLPAEARPPRSRAAKTLTAAVEPLLVPAKQAAPLCGVSAATWWRMHAGGLCPAPLKMSGRTLWRVEELRRWVEAGAPARKGWESMERARKGAR